MAEGLNYRDFIDEGGEPGEDELVAEYRFSHDETVEFEWAAGAIAAESSVG
ncbi:MAG: ribulose-bisphosphate carboxylase large subunit, partial [Candidatus Nanohaloarchaea archaeon]